MKINEDDSLMVQYIKEHTPKEAVVFLTGTVSVIRFSGRIRF